MACPFMLVRNLAAALRDADSACGPAGCATSGWPWSSLSSCSLPTSCSTCGPRPRWTAWLILRLLCCRTAGGQPLPGGRLLQVPLPPGPVQLYLLPHLPFGGQGRGTGLCRALPYQGLHQGPAANPGSRLRAVALPAAQRSATWTAPSAWTVPMPAPTTTSAISPRLPASELWVDPRRSGIGRFSRRPDLAALVVVFYLWRAAQCLCHGHAGLCPGRLAGGPARHPVRGAGAGPDLSSLAWW